MRLAHQALFLATLACRLMGASAPLAVVKAVISDRDGGATLAAGFEHSPGETLFFSFQVEGYAASTADRVHLSYKMDALDPHGVRIVEPVSAEIEETLAPEDKDWKPAARQEIVIPPLADSGAYKIVVSVTDLINKGTASKEVPFQVRGHHVDPSDTLVIRNVRFYRSEDDKQPLPKAAYRPGDTVWARFDIIGFKYGETNALDVSYDVAVMTSGAKVLYSQPQAGNEKTQSFYPKRYVPAVMSLVTKPNTHQGQYVVVLTAHDGIGNQTCEARQEFSIE